MKDAADSKLHKSLAYLADGFVSMEKQVVDELVAFTSKLF
jgi:hypothetical protein